MLLAEVKESTRRVSELHLPAGATGSDLAISVIVSGFGTEFGIKSAHDHGRKWPDLSAIVKAYDIRGVVPGSTRVEAAYATHDLAGLAFPLRFS